MSQIVYTELEATPIRWRYLNAVPLEPSSVADPTEKSFNTSAGDFVGSVINNTNYLSNFNVQSPSTYLGQRFSPSQPALFTGFKLRMNKTGSPTGTLYCSIVGWNSLTNRPDLNNVLASGSMSIASIAASFNTFTINFTSSIFLTPADRVALIVYPDSAATLNATNYITVRYSDANVYTPSDMLTSTNSGESWTTVTDRDIYAVSTGHNATTIYSGGDTISPSNTAASGSLKLDVSCKAVSGTIYFAADVGGSYGTGVSTSSSSPTTLTPLTPTTPIPQGSQTWRVWAAGSGKAYYVAKQLHEYYNVNPVYPRNLGFTELYLVSVTATSPNTLLRLNDRSSIHLPNSRDMFQVGEGFRTPVRKLYFVTGSGDVDLLGVE